MFDISTIVVVDLEWERQCNAFRRSTLECETATHEIVDAVRSYLHVFAFSFGFDHDLILASAPSVPVNIQSFVPKSISSTILSRFSQSLPLIANSVDDRQSSVHYSFRTKFVHCLYLPICSFYLLVQSRRRKRSTNHPLSSTPLFTLHSTSCSALNPHQVQSTFEWSYSIASLPSLELIYRLDSNERQEPAIPVRIVIRQSATSNELFSVQTHLQFDTTREFYFLNINDYLRQRTEQSLVIETTISNQTCRSSHADLLVSSRRLTHPSAQGRTKCQLKTIEVQFEELGLAYLIIRPKQYTFSYCDGSCTDLTLQETSLHAFLQSMVSRKNPGVPQPSCAPSQYADDNFLLRQIDGNVQIYPIKDIIVKQCACL